MFNCVKCRGSLRKIIYEGIEVERCLKCGGIWFDATEAEELKKIKGSEKLDNVNPVIGNHYNHLEKKIVCPKCKVKMQQVLDIDEYSIWYEKCPKCLGIWLDAGEFTKFKDNFKTYQLKNLTKYIFRPNKHY